MVFLTLFFFLTLLFPSLFVANLSYSCIVLFTAGVHDHNGKITCTYRSTPCPYGGRVMRLLLAKWKFDVRETRDLHEWLTTTPAHPGLLTCHCNGSTILRHFIISPSPRRAPANRLDAWLGLRQRAFLLPRCPFMGILIYICGYLSHVLGHWISRLGGICVIGGDNVSFCVLFTHPSCLLVRKLRMRFYLLVWGDSRVILFCVRAALLIDAPAAMLHTRCCCGRTSEPPSTENSETPRYTRGFSAGAHVPQP
jgi:hypothetical protein